jgi:hypothetical protein
LLLKDKNEYNGTHSLTVLPAYGTPGHKTTTAIESKSMGNKRTRSWAEIASNSI